MIVCTMAVRLAIGSLVEEAMGGATAVLKLHVLDA